MSESKTDQEPQFVTCTSGESNGGWICVKDGVVTQGKGAYPTGDSEPTDDIDPQ